MSLSLPERRRSPRVSVAQASWLAVPSTWPVQLADLSLGGMAFSSPYELEVGRTAAVRATLGRDAFSGQFLVRWSRPLSTTNGVRPQFQIGAAFLPFEDSSRRALETFLKLSPPSESEHENQGR
ncbi:MAG: PilZ domain-containing protein [Vicinamibacterales bacterium]